jgi:hypothetical protein
MSSEHAYADDARNSDSTLPSNTADPTETVAPMEEEATEPLGPRAPAKETCGEEDRGMALKTARLLNLLLTGVLTGNEFGGFVGFHPALYELPTEAHARAERAITSRFGKIMPPFMTAAILSFVPVLSLARDRRSTSYFFTLMAMLCYTSMLAVTFAGNMPVNRGMLEIDVGTVSGEELMELRRRWDQFHAARNVLNLLGFVSALLGALSEDTDDRNF